MLQPHSSSPAPLHSSIPTKLTTVPNQSFTPKFIPLRRSSTPTFSFTFPPNPSLSVRCRYSQLEPKPFPSPPQRSPPPASVGALPTRVYVGHSIYKGKAALTVSPRPPKFSPLDSGAFKISKEGYVLLQFAPGVGTREYDWNRKQIYRDDSSFVALPSWFCGCPTKVFSLSVSEMGTLVSFGAGESCEFFHDPFKGSSDECQVTKVLKVEPLTDGSGHLFNLSVRNKVENTDENIIIPVTKAELAVLSSIFNFMMPYLLGWHTFANSIKPDYTSRVNNANPRYGGEHGWNR